MIRLAVVGCGNMSKNFSDRFTRVDRLQVTAAVDIVPERAAAAAEALGPNVRAATDYRQVLDDVDALLLILPHHMHHEVTMACLKAGKHVLVEKPMANSEQECLEMIEAAEKAQRVLMVAYVMRYHPLVVKFKELLDSGKFGPCFHMSIWTEQYTHLPEGHWGLDPAKLGGGQFFSHGCHYVDLLLWMLGRPMQGTHLGTNFGTPWMKREGTSDIAIKFESGAVGYHMGTWGARGTRLGYAIHAHCTEGMLEADFREGRIVLHQFKRKAAHIEPHIEDHNVADDTGKRVENRFGVETVLARTDTGKQTDKELMHFRDCIETGRRPETDGWHSLQGLRVIWRMYEAERAGRVADLRGLGFDQVER